MKRIMIWLMIASLLAGTFVLTGCSDEEPESGETALSESDDAPVTGSKERKESKGLFMQVDKATGEMLIRRPKQETSATMGEKGERKLDDLCLSVRNGPGVRDVQGRKRH